MSRIFQAGSVVTSFVANTKNFMQGTEDVLSQLKELRANGGDMSATMNVVGKTSLAAGTALATGVGAMVAISANGTDSLKKLAAQTNSTGEEFDVLKEIVRDIKIQGIGDGMEDITNTVGQATQLFKGMKDQVDGAADSAMWYKEIFDVDTESSLKAVHSMSSNFNEEAKKAYDLMTFVRQEGGDKAQDLEDTFWEYAVHFKELGFSMDDMGKVMLNGMVNGNAFNYDKIGDAMKEFRLKFYDMPFTKDLVADFENEIIPSLEEFMSDKMGGMQIKSSEDMLAYQEKKFEVEQEYAKLVQETNEKNKEGHKNAIEANEAVNALRDIGMDPDRFLAQVRAGGKSTTGAIKELTTALSQVDDKALKDKYSVLFFGTQSEDLGRDFVDTFAGYENIEVEDGRLDSAKEIFTDGNLMASLREMGALFLDIAASIGAGLVPVLYFVVEGFNSIIRAVANFLNQYPLIGGSIGVILGVVSAVAILVGTYSALGGIVKGVAIGFRLLTAAMMMNPVGLIITGVILLVAAIGTLIHKTIGFKKLWEGIKDFFTDILPRAILKFVNVVSLPFRYLTDLILQPFRWLAELIDIQIPKLSKMNYETMFMGPKDGATNVTVNNNIQTNSVERNNVGSINSQLAEGSRNQALSMGY